MNKYKKLLSVVGSLFKQQQQQPPLIFGRSRQHTQRAPFFVPLLLLSILN